MADEASMLHISPTVSLNGIRIGIGIQDSFPAKFEMSDDAHSGYHQDQCWGRGGPPSWQYLPVRSALVHVHPIGLQCRCSTASTGTVLEGVSGTGVRSTKSDVTVRS